MVLILEFNNYALTNRSQSCFTILSLCKQVLRSNTVVRLVGLIFYVIIINGVKLLTIEIILRLGEE